MPGYRANFSRSHTGVWDEKLLDTSGGMTNNHTIERCIMNSSKIAITIESDMLAEVDALVKKRLFPNRSRAIQEAVKEKLNRLNQSLLARECANLDPEYEKALADEGLSADFSEWPKY